MPNYLLKQPLPEQQSTIDTLVFETRRQKESKLIELYLLTMRMRMAEYLVANHDVRPLINQYHSLSRILSDNYRRVGQ